MQFATARFAAACLAGLTAGTYQGTDEITAQWRVERRFEPTMPRTQAQGLMARWEHAVAQAALKPPAS